MVTLAPPETAISTFPATEVESCLRSELIDALKAEASIRGISLPTSTAQIVKTTIQIDSLVVISILCAVEPIVGLELPDSVVRAGGYTSIENAIGHLLPRIKAQCLKTKGAKPCQV